MTLDQRRSRREPDAVPDLLAALADDGLRTVLPFDRTAGDEVQGLLDDPAAVLDVVVRALRTGRWSIGIGVGPTEEPLPDVVRAGRGPAYVDARDAVEAAKRAAHPVCVRATEAPEAAEDAETALWLLAAVLERRSDAGWEAVDVRAVHPTQAAAAEALGISAQAMSQRLDVAGWTDEGRGRSLAGRLLARADRPEEGPR
ncbi:hypothetical protein CLV56_3590 [Mumia flava]|uniref:SatD family protein n=1 Tax=Mumia flava TaxID=1348852 RepID=A0A2M9B802_9ACTN|nr:SatD family protein [Mumia flava]PJJ54086.1 hypothetical protein CLV56_3590 [Mumia flava]